MKRSPHHKETRRVRSKHMKSRCNSSRSSRASSIDCLRSRSTRHVSPSKASGAYSSQSQAGWCPDRLWPVEGLRLSKYKKPVVLIKSYPEGLELLAASRDTVASSPLLVSSTKSNLRRRQRVSKRGSMSETDSMSERQTTTFMSNNPSVLSPIPGTPSLINASEIRDPTQSYSKTAHNKRLSHWPSEAYPQIASASAMIHSLPLMLPANADYECRVEWESDRGENGNNEASNLWRKLEQECGLSPVPASPACGNFTGDILGSIGKRGRWKVKVLETPIMASPEPTNAEPEPISLESTCMEEFFLAESTTGVDSGHVPVLREVSLTELLPPLNSYKRLSSLLSKSSYSRYKRTTKSRRSSALRLNRSKSQVSGAGKSIYTVHRDVSHALRGVWEDYGNGWSDEDIEGAMCSHLAMLRSRSRSMTRSKSGMGRHLGIEDAIWPPLNQGPHTTSMIRSLTLKSRASTAGMDSLIDLYASI